jgi:hypothetical protein
MAGMSGRMVNLVLLIMRRRYVATASDMSSGMPVHACTPELAGWDKGHTPGSARQLEGVSPSPSANKATPRRRARPDHPARHRRY